MHDVFLPYLGIFLNGGWVVALGTLLLCQILPNLESLNASYTPLGRIGWFQPGCIVLLANIKQGSKGKMSSEFDTWVRDMLVLVRRQVCTFRPTAKAIYWCISASISIDWHTIDWFASWNNYAYMPRVSFVLFPGTVSPTAVDPGVSSLHNHLTESPNHYLWP